MGQFGQSAFHSAPEGGVDNPAEPSASKIPRLDWLFPLGDSQRRSELSERDAMAIETVADWLRGRISGPDENLGRSGPVCPFVPPSLRRNKVLIGVYPGESVNSSEIETLAQELHRSFLEHARQTPMRYLATYVVVFRKNDSSTVDCVTQAQRRLKEDFVRDGIMLGKFFHNCQDKGLWNLRFKPMQSPLPILVVRHMMPSDLAFLFHRKDFVGYYLQYHRKRFWEQVRYFIRRNISVLWAEFKAILRRAPRDERS